MSLQLQGTLAVIGAGKMGLALIEGLLNEGFSREKLVIQDPSPSEVAGRRLHDLGLEAFTDASARLSAPAGVILLAVKPQVMDAVLPDVVRLCGGDTVVISVAAGKTLATFEEAFGSATAIVRAMPNTPAAVGAGMTVCVGNKAAGAWARKLAEDLLSTVGRVAWLDDEALMDAVTAVSGSGPAYVFLLAEALAKAGEAAGLDTSLAETLARETVAGAGKLLGSVPESAEVLRQAVTSPGGTTQAALKVLMDDEALADLLRKAVLAARDRSRELG